MDSMLRHKNALSREMLRCRKNYGEVSVEFENPEL